MRNKTLLTDEQKRKLWSEIEWRLSRIEGFPEWAAWCQGCGGYFDHGEEGRIRCGWCYGKACYVIKKFRDEIRLLRREVKQLRTTVKMKERIKRGINGKDYD